MKYITALVSLLPSFAGLERAASRSVVSSSSSSPPKVMATSLALPCGLDEVLSRPLIFPDETDVGADVGAEREVEVEVRVFEVVDLVDPPFAWLCETFLAQLATTPEYLSFAN